MAFIKNKFMCQKDALQFVRKYYGIRTVYTLKKVCKLYGYEPLELTPGRSGGTIRYNKDRLIEIMNNK